MAIWSQAYNPVGNLAASAIVAAVPAMLLLVLVAGLNFKIHRAALAALGACFVIAIGPYHMPVGYAAASCVYGAAYGLFPIAWLVLNIIFIYQMTVKRQLFDVLRRSLAQVARDPRIQLILIAYAFGAFLEGMSGFGAPVAITAAILIQLGFTPLDASGLALVANTAPVAFGSLGIPIVTLAQVTDLDLRALSATTAGLLVVFSFGVPFLIVVMLSGWRGLRGVWPAALVAGLSYTVPQYLIATYVGPSLAAPIAGLSCIASLVVLLRLWKPRDSVKSTATAISGEPTKKIIQAWMPWAILTLLILIWGLPPFTRLMDRLCPLSLHMPALDALIRRTQPIAPPGATPLAAVFKLNLLAATGTGIFFASIVIGIVTGFSPREWIHTYLETMWRIRLSLLTIAAMFALGTLTRYSGSDATMGLAMARSGRLYPFFGTLLGWFGAAITGSDTSTNVLFGSLQKITAQQIGISAILMGAANTCGGVMGKMVSSQSIVVASTATGWYGQEGKILRYVLLYSIAMATLMGVLVFLASCVPPFTSLVAG